MLFRKRGADAGTRERGNIASGLLNEKILPDIYLRRPKLILDLPAKDEIIVFCELSSTQKDIYEHILEQPDFVLLKQANGPCDCAANNEVFREYKRRTTMEQKIYYVRQNKDKIVRRCRCHYRCPWDYSSSDGIAVNAVLWREKHQSLSGELAQCENCPWCISLPALALLNRLVSHVSLLQAKENPDRWSPWAREYAKAMRELAHAKGFLPSEMVAENKIPGGYFRDDSLMSYENYCELSGKLRVLGRLLKRIYHKQGRALVFSAYTTVLDVIQRFLLTLPGLETYEYRRVDGSTPLKERNRLVDEFNNNPNILAFLLSTRAMGQGVNLTAANNVIIFDVEWNPANDAQAQDRYVCS
jgi:SNF2 family DNA or RNA helicase